MLCNTGSFKTFPGAYFRENTCLIGCLVVSCASQLLFWEAGPLMQNFLILRTNQSAGHMHNNADTAHLGL